MNKKISLLLMSCVFSGSVGAVFAAPFSVDNDIDIPKVLLPQSPNQDGKDNLGDHVAKENLNMKNFFITNLSTIIDNETSLVNMLTLKTYIDKGISDNLGSHVASKILNMSGKKIEKVSSSFTGDDKDLVNLETLKTAISQMAGDNLGDHLARRNVLINGNTIDMGEVLSYDPVTGAPVRGNGVKVSEDKITGLSLPSDNADVTNKEYVDGMVSGIKTKNKKAGDGITVSVNPSNDETVIAVDSTVVRTINPQTIDGVKRFLDETWHTANVFTHAVNMTTQGNPITFYSANNPQLSLSVPAKTRNFIIKNVEGTVDASLNNRVMSLNGSVAPVRAFPGSAAIDSFLGVRSSETGGVAYVFDNDDVNLNATSEIMGRKLMQSGSHVDYGRIAIYPTSAMIAGTPAVSGSIEFLTRNRDVFQKSMTIKDGNLVIASGRADGLGRIKNLKDPVDPQDAVNLRTLKAHLVTVKDDLGNHTAVTNLDIANNSVINVNLPVNGGDAANKTYVDNLIRTKQMHKAGDGIGFGVKDAAGLTPINVNASVVRTSGDQIVAGVKSFTSAGNTVNGGLGIVSNGKKNLSFKRGDGTSEAAVLTDPAKSLVLTTNGPTGTATNTLTLRQSDGSIYASGTYNANNKKFVMIADPTLDPDFVNLRTLKAMLPLPPDDNLGNHTATTNLNVRGFKVINVADPVSGGDATNKRYVDGLFGRLHVLKTGDGYAVSGPDAAGERTITADATIIRTFGNQSMSGVKDFRGNATSASDNVIITSDATKQVSLTDGTVIKGGVQNVGSDGTLRAFVNDATGATQSVLIMRPGDGAIFPSGATGKGFYHANNKKVVAVADPTDPLDLVNLRTLKAKYTGANGVTVVNQVMSTANDVVRTVGDQTIDGQKYFTSGVGAGSSKFSSLLNINSFVRTREDDVQDRNYAFNLGGGTSLVNPNRRPELYSHELSIFWNAHQDGVTDDPAITFGILQPYSGQDGYGEVFKVDKYLVVFRVGVKMAKSTLNLSGGRIGALADPLNNGDAVNLRTANNSSISLTNNHSVEALQVFEQLRSTNSAPTNWNDAVNMSYALARIAAKPSDVRLKRDIRDISGDDGLTWVRIVSPKTYVMRDTGNASNGVIAQELQKASPEMVKSIGNGMLGVDYMQTLAPMIAALQKLDSDVSGLEARMASVRADQERVLRTLE